jgi:MFS family permease
MRKRRVVETGLLLTCGSLGASVSAVVVGLFGDAFGRRRALLILAGFMTLTGIAFAATDNFVILTAVAFIGVSVLSPGAAGGWAAVIDNRVCLAEYPVP